MYTMFNIIKNISIWKDYSFATLFRRTCAGSEIDQNCQIFFEINLVVGYTYFWYSVNFHCHLSYRKFEEYKNGINPYSKVKGCTFVCPSVAKDLANR